MPVSYNTPLNRTRAVEWLLATLLFLWGWQLVQPNIGYFDQPVYAIMASIATEAHWGVAAVIVSTFRLVALFINGWWKRTPVVRFLGAVAGGMFWLCIGVCMYYGARLTGAKLTAGFVFYVPFFIWEGWCVLSTGYDMAQEGLLGTRPPVRYVARRS